MRFRKALLVPLTVMFMAVPIACHSEHRACAADTVLAKGTSSPPPRTPSPPPRTPSRSPSAPSPRTKAPTNSGQSPARSKTNAPTNAGQRPATQKTSGGYTYKAPNGSSYNVPRRVSGSSYRAPTGNVYIIHTHSYYHVGGYHDLWDPFDWTNRLNPLSPWYRPDMYRSC